MLWVLQLLLMTSLGQGWPGASPPPPHFRVHRQPPTGCPLCTHRLPEYWLPPRKPYLSVLRRASPFISESEPKELTSSGKDSKVPDMRLTESK